MREQARANIISYDAEVGADGQLPLPQNVKLSPGRQVHVELRLRRRRTKRGAKVEDDPIWNLVGFIPPDKGPRDVAERHDHYLYGYGSRNKKAGEA